MDLISKYKIILYLNLVWNKILDQIIIKTSLSVMILFLSSVLLIIVYLIKDYNVCIFYNLLFNIGHHH